MTDPVVADTDVFITRSFAAPRSVVWRFWIDPERITTWFGPDAFHVPTESVKIELRLGGAWHLTMADNDGNEFPIRGTIIELVEEELLVVQMDADTGAGDVRGVVLRVQFHDHGDRTRITLHQGPFTAEQREMTAQGWELSFAKIDRIVQGESA